MVAILPERDTRTSRTRPTLIDCDFHNELDSIKDLYPYLAQRWIDHIETFGLQRATGGYFPRFMDHREDAKPPSGRRSGSEVAWSRADFLDPYNVAHAMLIPLTSAAGVLNLDLGTALATAVNDWQVAEWLDPEPRLRASIAVAPEDPLAAAREVERCGRDKRFVQVFMPGRTHEPLGRRKYWPIYEAASKYGLPIMSHAFGAYGYPITGAGQASFYVEEHVGPAQAAQANVISLVAEGVFETFPNLNFVSVENGFGWIPSLMWRMDATYKQFHAEVPHLKRLPSEYIRQHVYLTTQPVEEPHKPQQFLQLLEHFGDMVDHILFASDYPHWDSDDPDFALPNSLADEYMDKSHYENGRRLYNL
jgi:predicted TIM-barrel fold metal-dependent hydrolase